VSKVGCALFAFALSVVELISNPLFERHLDVVPIGIGVPFLSIVSALRNHQLRRSSKLWRGDRRSCRKEFHRTTGGGARRRGCEGGGTAEQHTSEHGDTDDYFGYLHMDLLGRDRRTVGWRWSVELPSGRTLGDLRTRLPRRDHDDLGVFPTAWPCPPGLGQGDSRAPSSYQQLLARLPRDYASTRITSVSASTPSCAMPRQRRGLHGGLEGTHVGNVHEQGNVGRVLRVDELRMLVMPRGRKLLRLGEASQWSLSSHRGDR